MPKCRSDFVDDGAGEFARDVGQIVEFLEERTAEDEDAIGQNRVRGGSFREGDALVQTKARLIRRHVQYVHKLFAELLLDEPHGCRSPTG